ncbi:MULTISPECIES: peptide chain release factor N(5)-glutamine methyltransferase [Mammaliicoccus]|jgi:release factor glutamine methyltransferase|uniref:peptide chain release factor N(5)-glutamine methyltransferase n=1 Tax=Mammaliicoccus TaxID=2803850 RepID=UPI001C4DF7BF|nr:MULTISPECIES: peptide chain release factor N(5)-glutamine methyltransferase [Mammaliicoccus]MBW0769792.1 peptide chain release factor N(5)-glutamine methyltransferase [Mammaliicoccus lentus]MCR1873523.1 peptide chain release factor N(5)-glutamine methyltransferase [Mammaliicoccus lentus]MDQ7142353.1 peptide chain release factor N(5)-glutamine methyltransferase [Mammaliicoccus lentus]WQK50887.1 peptide chain release factor N(5)-glutamine methyltransferase [Mammaliicoccus lentus]
MENYNFHTLLTETYKALSARGLETSRADWLLEDISGLSRTQILLKQQEPVPDNILKKFLTYRERMYLGEPVQYIVGFAEFYGRKFIVNNDVLIPRPETEELVLQTLNTINQHEQTVCDIGTGTGAIAISLKKERTNLNVIATDISDDALKVAKENARLNQAEIEFLQGDALKPLINNGIKVDVLLSNPPYISYEEKVEMSETVLEYEPHLALFTQNNGLAIYKRILNDLDKVMKKDGLVIFEIGHLQGEILKSYIHEHYKVKNLAIIKDINQKNRMIQFNWMGC